MASSPTTPLKDQYHHYIPRFILRRFQSDQGPVKSKKQRKKDYRKGLKSGVDPESIFFYDVTTGVLDRRPIAKVYGASNLYKDVKDVENANHLEEKFSRLENDAAVIITDLHASLDKGTFRMKRKALECLIKFLFLMHYRKAAQSLTHLNEDLPGNAALVEWIKKYKEMNGLDTHVDAWLHGLQYHLETPHYAVVQEAEAIKKKYGSFGLEQMMLKKVPADIGNWHAIEYESIANGHFLGIVEAADGMEFVLGSNGFGLWEGVAVGGAHLHRLYVVSPRVALILRCNICKMPGFASMPFVNSSFITIPLEPATTQYAHGRTFTYSNQHDTMAAAEKLARYIATPTAQEDLFTFKIVKLTASDTHSVNEVILLNVAEKRTSSITFSSKECVLDTLRAYEKSNDPFVKMNKAPYMPLINELSATSDTTSPSTSTASATTSTSATASTTSATTSSATRNATASGDNAAGDAESEQEDRARDHTLTIILQAVVSGALEFSSTYDRAYRVFHAATDDAGMRNPFSAAVRKLSSGAIERFSKPLRPLPPSFRASPHALLVEKLSSRDSDLVFTIMTPVMTMLGIKYEEDAPLSKLTFEAATIGFLTWLAKNRGDAFQLLFPGTRITR